jgi:hypothetical protein
MKKTNENIKNMLLINTIIVLDKNIDKHTNRIEKLNVTTAEFRVSTFNSYFFILTANAMNINDISITENRIIPVSIPKINAFIWVELSIMKPIKKPHEIKLIEIIIILFKVRVSLKTMKYNIDNQKT